MTTPRNPVRDEASRESCCSTTVSTKALAFSVARAPQALQLIGW